jgi:hypothetical protein
VIPCDADEVWQAPTGTLAEWLRYCNASVVQCTGYDFVPQRSDTADPNPLLRITHRRAHPQPLPKVAFRASADVAVHMGNHDVTHPDGGNRANGLTLRHYQYRTCEQMARKVRQGKAAYDATDMPDTYGLHWRALGALDDAALRGSWEALLDEPGLVVDPW